MTKFIPVRYMGRAYPAGILCPIEEVAGHLDKTNIKPSDRYSLHTEYSFIARDLDSVLLQSFPTLRASQVRSVPLLWRSDEWADEFAAFAIRLVADNPAPDIIEIHPPFTDYCPDIPTFLRRYSRFETAVHRAFPRVRICIENRAGTQYRRSGFLLSSFDGITKMLSALIALNEDLRVVLDIPQLFTAEDYDLAHFPIGAFQSGLARIAPGKEMISGLHIWGRKGQLSAHVGTLDDLFQGDSSMKRRVVETIVTFFDDGRERYFVPEVNSSEGDLQAIVRDFLEAGAEFM
jgi:hypothetical protein